MILYTKLLSLFVFPEDISHLDITWQTSHGNIWISRKIHGKFWVCSQHRRFCSWLNPWLHQSLDPEYWPSLAIHTNHVDYFVPLKSTRSFVFSWIRRKRFSSWLILNQIPCFWKNVMSAKCKKKTYTYHFYICHLVSICNVIFFKGPSWVF